MTTVNPETQGFDTGSSGEGRANWIDRRRKRKQADRASKAMWENEDLMRQKDWERADKYSQNEWSRKAQYDRYAAETGLFRHAGADRIGINSEQELREMDRQVREEGAPGAVATGDDATAINNGVPVENVMAPKVEARVRERRFSVPGGSNLSIKYDYADVGGPNTPNGPTTPPSGGEEPPVKPGGEVPPTTPTGGGTRTPKRTSADAATELKLLTDFTDKNDGQKPEGMSDDEYDDILGRASALADEHDILARDETRKANNKAQAKAKKQGIAPTGTAPHAPRVIEGGAVRKTTSKSDRERTAYALSETEGLKPKLGAVADDGGIGLGDKGARPQPGGESGNTPGKQFEQSGGDEGSGLK